jgi:hypothetical protein
VTVRRKRGLKVTGEVVGRDGRGIEGAAVRAEPMPGVELLPGTRETATTDVDGRFTLDGLVRAKVVVTADHPRYVPTSLEPMEPGGPSVRIVLVPAFLVAFSLRTSDGTEPKNPSLAWQASGRGLPAIEQVSLLQRDLGESSEAPRPGGWLDYLPVKVPADRAEAVFQVKAESCAPWTSAVEPLPVDGGEKTYEVTLERDLSLGGLRVVLEDRDHKPLSFTGVSADATFARKDAVAIPAGIVMQPGEALVVPSIPAGPYMVYVRSPLHAPAAVAVDVVAGQQAEARAVLGPPAKLRVRFVASEAVIVKFRVLAGREPAYPYPEGASSVATTEEERVPVFHAGADGLVLTGLGPGPHTVQVVSEDLSGTPTPVDLVEGETRDVEMTVVRK